MKPLLWLVIIMPLAGQDAKPPAQEAKPAESPVPAAESHVTGSIDFPTLKPAQAKAGSADLLNSDAFVAKLDASGTKLVYSTYLGGSGIDTASP